MSTYMSKMSEEVHVCAIRHDCAGAVVSGTWYGTHAHPW